MALDVFALVGGARVDHTFDAGGALLARVDQLAQGACRVGDQELEQSVEFTVLQRDAGAAECIKVGEDLRGASDLEVLAGDVDGVRAEIDLYMEAVFKEPKILVTRAVEGFNTGSDVDCFFDQAGF